MAKREIFAAVAAVITPRQAEPKQREIEEKDNGGTLG
jgi:hypothetical protein